ncbi:hypothetical protein OQA88_6363 [Cercophora sp. LCS_1]
MPCLRGVEVSLTTTGIENKAVREYPHPESSSVQLRAGDDPRLQSPTRSSASSANVAGAGSPTPVKVDPKISVYIPSVPGSAFAIQYSVKSVPPPPCRYIYFKLFMNARFVAAWGIDLTTTKRGKVVKSLWRPSPRYGGKAGLEARNFVFLPGQDKKGIADDGGLIEVQVFRARDRQSLAPKLEDFRFQDNYGIASPSIGLVVQPQDAFYYEWALIDARDTPYSTFRFHYRSLESLRQLNLVPPTYSTRALIPTSAINQLVGKRTSDRNVKAADSKSGFGLEDEMVFGNGGRHETNVEMEAPTGQKDGVCLETPPKLVPVSTLSYGIPEPSKEARDGFRDSYLQRPLPELPEKEHALSHRRSSLGSAYSGVPSITMSLKQSIERGSFDLTAKVEFGVASLVQLHRNNSGKIVGTDEQRAEEAANNSTSDYGASPPSTIGSGSGSPKKLSPGSYPATTARDLDMFTPEKKKNHSSPRAMRSTQSLMYPPTSDKGLAKLKVNEPDRNSITPSPTRSPFSSLPSRV